MNLDGEVDAALVDKSANLLAALQTIAEVEVGARGETRDQVPALLAVIEIEHRDRHVAHLEGRRVAEDHHLDDCRSEEHEARLGVAHELDELLDQHLAQPAEHRFVPPYSICLRKLSTATPPISSANPSNARISKRSAPTPTPLRKTPLRT